MSTGKPRDPNKEHFWRAQLLQWRRSGLSVRAFCEQRGLSLPSFYAWRRTIAHRDDQAPAFLPVQLLPTDTATPASTAAASGLELLLPSGLILRLGIAFDAPTLRRLLPVLEELNS